MNVIHIVSNGKDILSIKKSHISYIVDSSGYVEDFGKGLLTINEISSIHINIDNPRLSDFNKWYTEILERAITIYRRDEQLNELI